MGRLILYLYILDNFSKRELYPIVHMGLLFFVSTFSIWYSPTPGEMKVLYFLLSELNLLIFLVVLQLFESNDVMIGSYSGSRFRDSF